MFMLALLYRRLIICVIVCSCKCSPEIAADCCSPNWRVHKVPRTYDSLMREDSKDRMIFLSLISPLLHYNRYTVYDLYTASCQSRLSISPCARRAHSVVITDNTVQRWSTSRGTVGEAPGCVQYREFKLARAGQRLASRSNSRVRPCSPGVKGETPILRQLPAQR